LSLLPLLTVQAGAMHNAATVEAIAKPLKN
jgi:hypothetical protein